MTKFLVFSLATWLLKHRSEQLLPGIEPADHIVIELPNAPANFDEILTGALSDFLLLPRVVCGVYGTCGSIASSAEGQETCALFQALQVDCMARGQPVAKFLRTLGNMSASERVEAMRFRLSVLRLKVGPGHSPLLDDGHSEQSSSEGPRKDTEISEGHDAVALLVPPLVTPPVTRRKRR